MGGDGAPTVYPMTFWRTTASVLFLDNRFLDLMPDFGRVTRQVFALYAKKDYENGLRVSIRADRAFPRMRNRTLYWVACFYSLLGKSEAAISTL